MDCQDYSTVCAERKKGQHLGMAERGAIKALKQHGLGTRAIAREIECVPSTILNEPHRGTPVRKSSKGNITVKGVECAINPAGRSVLSLCNGYWIMRTE